MKKMSKILAVLMSIVVFASVFAIASGAISSSSSAKEILNYYENSIIKTSAKEEILKADNVFKYRYVADYSSLEGDDREETIAFDEELELFSGVWSEEEYAMYFYCDAYDDYYVEGRSEFVDFFSIKRDVRRFDLKFKSAKCSVAKNGDATLTFVYLEDLGEGDKNTMTYTAVINKNGYIKSYSLKQVMEYTSYSVEDNPYKTTDELVDKYTFVYKKVPVDSIELSTDKITLSKDEEITIGCGEGYDIQVIIKPDNATYTDFDLTTEDCDVADWYVNDDGEYVIYAVGSGETTLNVYAYEGDLVATCDIVVEGSFFDAIIAFFRNLFESIFGIFMF